MMSGAPEAATVQRALAEFPALVRPEAAPLSGGLINVSFAVRAEDGEYVLQRVHPVFAPEVHDNIAAVSEQLRRRGQPSPRLLQSRGGQWFADLGVDGVWRVMTRLPGISFDTIQSPAQARAAGARVGRFMRRWTGSGTSFARCGRGCTIRRRTCGGWRRRWQSTRSIAWRRR